MPQAIYILLTCYQLTRKRQGSLVELQQCEKCVMEQRIGISVFKSFDFQLKHPPPHHHPNAILSLKRAKVMWDVYSHQGFVCFFTPPYTDICIFQ